QGNYIFPEGFDAETNEWLEGFDEQRQAWEARYAESERRYQAHTAQMERRRQQAEEAAAEAPAGNYSTDSAEDAPAAEAVEESAGSLASDEQLAALREKLAGN
ncbi:MAG: 30S ribosomal protein S1, partial [Corynebacterium glutamicum]|nr:30S ribosomal protein S1 [Corynebacterium glutamicum]